MVIIPMSTLLKRNWKKKSNEEEDGIVVIDGGIIMTEKRFECMGDGYFVDNLEDADLDNREVVDMLNYLHEEKEQLQSRVAYLERKIERERNSYFKQHEKWAEEINSKSWKITELIIEYDTTNKYSEKDVIDKIKDIMGLVMIE